MELASPRIAHALAFAVALFASAVPAGAAHHEPVIQVVSVHVESGKLDKYRSKVAELAGVMKRIGSSAKVRMWRLSVGGPETGSIIVGIEYPTSAAWATDSAKAQADSEWIRIVSGLDSMRTVTSNAVWRDVSVTRVAPPAPGSGGVLAITGVQVKPGQLDAYRKRVDSARGITKRLGLNGEFRLWHAELAGSNSGQVAVGIEYANLAAYVADQGKLAADAEWRKFLADLGAMRTVTGRWLYEEITP